MHTHRTFAEGIFAVAAGVVVNIAVKETTHLIPSMPLFMDSIGTVAAAFFGGLVPGLLAGLLSNLSYSILFLVTKRASDFQPIFAFCSMATALTVFLYDRSKPNRLSMPDFAFLSILVSLVNSVIGGIISAFVFGGIEQYPTDFIVAGLIIQDMPVLASTIISRIPINFIDKTIAVVAGYALAKLTSKMCGRERVSQT